MSLLGGSVLDDGGGGGGDIWSTGAFSFESPLKDLLDGGEYATEDLLAQDELLQELRGLHPVLTRYFGTEAAVTRLLRYVVMGASDDPPAKATKATTAAKEDDDETTTTPQPGEWLYRYLEEKKGGSGQQKPSVDVTDPMLVRVRFPYMACEILCCELPQTIDTLVEGYVTNDGDDGGGNNDVDETNTDTVIEPKVETAATLDAVEVASVAVTTTRPRLLDLLFSVLHDTVPGALDDYRAGYLDKILTVLFRRRPEAMTEYMDHGGIPYGGPSATRHAVLRHLYSYSMTQIAQRLLLPPRPKPAAAATTADPATAPEDATTDDDASPEIAATAAAGQDILGGEEDDDDPLDPDMNGAGIKCDWYKCRDAVPWLLELLRGRSIGDGESVLTAEQRLSMSLNASEVFITVIQNSMLSSDTMLALTTVENWNTLIAAVLPLENEPFSSHDSFQTSAMNVIESLVLQLGGYGAVGTMALLPEEGEDATAGGPAAGAGGDAGNPELSHELIADLENLLFVLPRLLHGFAQLLTHPSTKDWKSTMQFSQHASVTLLGMSRLKIVRVLESLVLLGDPDVDHCLVESGCLGLCLDLFWEFQWCSMLHQSVANLLVHVFEGQNVRYEIQEYLLVKCNLLGRLMDSFGKAEHVIEQAKAAMPDATALTDSADPLPVSEEDVEAAMEVGSTTDEGATAKEGGTPQVSQSFRYGYMGHVIIICQALVQACTTEWEDGMGEGGPDGAQAGYSADKTEGTSEAEPLMIAELVKNHDLAEQWKEFVNGTLSTEISIQSTPLGGYAGPSTDPLAAHRPGMEMPQPGGRRPGLADDDMDMGSGPPPPRGMLGGGDTIDMDDNDLDVAAQMLSNFGLGARPNTTATCDDSDSDSGFSGSGDSEKSYNSGETNNSGGAYAFDDPLGSAGGLGIELGKLTKLGSAGSKKKKPAPVEAKKEEEEDDANSHSSSDEEPPRPEPDNNDDNSNGEENEEENNSDVPVMDLFAGNFSHGESSPGDDKPSDAPKESADFDAFANFDAFTGSPPPADAPSTEATEAPAGDLFVKAPSPDLDDFASPPAPAPPEDDGFGDFVSAESIPPSTTATDETKATGGGSDPFAVNADAFSATSDPFATSSKSSGAAALDPFDPSADDEGDFGTSTAFRTTFSGSFDDVDMTELKIAPSDELMADAAAEEEASPPDVPESVPEESTSATTEPEAAVTEAVTEVSDDSPSSSDKSTQEEGVLVSSS